MQNTPHQAQKTIFTKFEQWGTGFGMFWWSNALQWGQASVNPQFLWISNFGYNTHTFGRQLRLTLWALFCGVESCLQKKVLPIATWSANSLLKWYLPTPLGRALLLSKISESIFLILEPLISVDSDIIILIILVSFSRNGGVGPIPHFLSLFSHRSDLTTTNVCDSVSLSVSHKVVKQ